ncbi:hypothetical protein ACFOE1_06155 [Agromyces mediolanus]|uniref:Uncharacterized protein n=1 Tax=Agromyces mediolanus TaxID=41986 RepID=A0A918FBE0_AGRME|nr:hypothetical protein [Agromyces mediolanus]GGR27618.1 hypothetical protein GCM10010196_21570 [Agromyces mediolanus]GLJ71953.1 hypothetical protein GCM10017583_12090 [Agromyces mediolanus]
MDPNAIIDSYVGDVVRHLPRRQRTDVARELRSLLREEVAGRAADGGRPVDADVTMELLAAFGRPADVADRYRPAGFTVIRPSDAPRFTWFALGGIAVIWLITLPAALLGVPPVVGWEYGADAWWGRLTVWWFGPGLGAFWWPGVLITFTLLSVLATRRRESVTTAWAPTPAPVPRNAIDRDLVNRPLGVLFLALALLGASALLALPWLGSWAPDLPEPVLAALALDPEFLQWRAPWLLLLWAAELALFIAVLLTGRWGPITQAVRGALDLVFIALLLWWVLGGPIFATAAADETTKFILVAFVIAIAVDAVVALRRAATGRRLVRTAAAPL